jgi:hypothetical protein
MRAAFAGGGRRLWGHDAIEPDRGTNDMAFYELRQYKVLPGKMDE